MPEAEGMLVFLFHSALGDLLDSCSLTLEACYGAPLPLQPLSTASLTPVLTVVSVDTAPTYSLFSNLLTSIYWVSAMCLVLGNMDVVLSLVE